MGILHLSTKFEPDWSTNNGDLLSDKNHCPEVGESLTKSWCLPNVMEIRDWLRPDG